MPGHPCAKGCYNCLLSYSNQLVHELIDRHAARSLLLAISQGETVPAGPGVSRTDHSIKLIGQADSTLEAEFIRWLKDNGYRLPDAAQVTVPGTYAKPDFVYRLQQRPGRDLHRRPRPRREPVAERDAAAESRLENKGWLVIRVRWNADWRAIMDENPSVFGQGRHRQRQQGSRQQGSRTAEERGLET